MFSHVNIFHYFENQIKIISENLNIPLFEILTEMIILDQIIF